MKGLPQGARAKLSPTNDVATRAQAGAAADEVVWDVLGARGVVTVHERAGAVRGLGLRAARDADDHGAVAAAGRGRV